MTDLTRFGGTDQDVYGLLDRKQVLRSKSRVAKREAADRHPIPKHEQGDRFVRGPIPCDWLRLALSAGGKAGHLAWAIWWLAGVQQSNPLKLTKRVLGEFHISTRTANRLLFDFERAGLVEVYRKRGRSPIITLLTPSRDEEANG